MAKRHDVIGVETLAVKAMMVRAPGKRRRNQSIADASFGELLRQLDYKTTWYGATLVKADRYYPSSKTCSTCRTVKTKLPLNQHTYTCDNCGLSLDRDLNAAINLAQQAARAAEPSDPMAGFVTGGATQKTPPDGAAGDETRTRHDHPVVAGSVFRKERHVPPEVTTTS